MILLILEYRRKIMVDKIKTNFGEVQLNNYATTNNNIGYYHSRTITEPDYNLKSMDLDLLRTVKKVEDKMSKKKRGLYQVILVDPKEGKIIFNNFIICSKAEDVLLEAGAGEVIRKQSLEVSEVDKIINYLGEIRRTKKGKDGVVELIDSEA
jgi:hypothetical protein